MTGTGILTDAQAAMRQRQSRKQRQSRRVKRSDGDPSVGSAVPKPNRSKKRVPTHSELVQLALAGHPYVMSERRQPKPKALPEQATPVEAKTERHGKCWNEFGMVNADPPPPVQGSIPNWGLKIKLRDR